MTLIKSLLVLTLLSCSLAYGGSLTRWDILPAESTLTFTGTQNGAPVTGAFKSFSGTINVDPTQYENSNVDIVINVNSLSVSYAELATILITPDWFNVKAFPKAEFKSTKITKVNDKTYAATGLLTIKNKSAPITITFSGVESPKDQATLEGKTTIKRSVFGVGEGEWSGSDVIKDDVIVNFKLAVVHKK